MMCVNICGEFRRILIFTSAGKPVYSYGITDQEVFSLFSSTLTAALSKLSFVMSKKIYSSEGNELKKISDYLKWMSSESHIIVALERKGILLCCISPFPSDTARYLKGLLEHIYYQIIMILTGSIHKILDSRPNFDIQQMLSNSDIKIIDQTVKSAQISFDSAYCFYNFNKNSKAAKLITQDINNNNCLPIVSKNLSLESQPLECRYRKEINSIISKIKIEEILGGLLFESKKLVSWFGSKYMKNLPSTDFSLLKNVTSTLLNKKTLTNEFWIPVCLPTISTVSYIYCYIQHWQMFHELSNSATETCFILLSSSGDTKIFEKCSEHSKNCNKILIEIGYYRTLESSKITRSSLNKLFNVNCYLGAEILHFALVSIAKNNYITSEAHPDIQELRIAFQMYYNLIEIAHSQIRKQNESSITIILSAQKFKYLMATTQEFHMFLTFSSKTKIDQLNLTSIINIIRINTKHFFV